MDLSVDQQEAFEDISRFIEAFHVDKPYLVMHGLAGTGKTFLLSRIIEQYPGLTLTAFTGKAASVLRARVGVPVSTLHSTIYDFRGLAEDEFETGKKNPIFTPKGEPLPGRVVLVDECFVKGTPIDTPLGKISINHLQPGHLILNAYGVDRVVGVFKKKAGDYVEQVIAGTETFTCSQDHEFFTRRGLVRARDLRSGDQLVRTRASMRLLQGVVHPERTIWSVLQSELWNALASSVREIQGEISNSRLETLSTDSFRFSQKSQRASPSEKFRSSFQSTFRSRENNQNCRNNEKKRNIRQNVKRREWQGSDSSSTLLIRDSRSAFSARVCCASGEEDRRISDELQAGYSRPDEEDWDRGEWLVSPRSESDISRSEEDQQAIWSRVDSVKSLERGDPRLDQFRDADGELYLYDIQAERHHSFSVGGVLVHNCSMIGGKVANDLLDTGARVIAAGDPGQLPPVRDSQFFTDPDATLTTIHRQALESPIIRQAHAVRHGGTYEGDGDGFRVVSFVDEAEILGHDIVLCWRNRTRTKLNHHKRALLGYEGPQLVPGEPIMALKNDHRIGVYNGAVYSVVEHLKEAMVVSDGERNIAMDPVTIEGFDPRFEEHRYGSDYLPFALAYASTTHKSQGSEYGSVLFFDECTSADWRALTYTGITRAVDRCTMVRWR